MAPKRKESTREENPKKRARVSIPSAIDKKDAGRSDKRQAKEQSESKAITTAIPASAQLTITVKEDDDIPFPRGGASVLTPLEQKQINLQAKKDVLFEQSNGKNRIKGKKNNKVSTGDELDFSESENDEENESGAEQEGKKQPSKKSRRSKKSRKEKDKLKEKQGVKIEGLSFKVCAANLLLLPSSHDIANDFEQRITAGAKLLGQITSINAHDIGLALPNNLTGYVPLTSISRIFSEKLEKILANAENNDADSEDEEDDDAIDLKAHFSLGQYLRATVIATEANAKNGKKGKKHLELSIDPREANSGLHSIDFVQNVTVQASVVSVEDHGIVMDLGLEDLASEGRGFMAKKEIPYGLDMSKIKPGSVFLCMVTGSNDSRTVIKLSGNLSATANLKKAVLSEAPTIQAYQPGTAAEVLLTEVTAHGMAGKIMGMIDAVVDSVQSGACDGSLDLENKYKLGAKIRARIISTLGTGDDDAPKKVGFSLLDHVGRFTPTVLEKSDDEHTPAISTVVHECEVVSVEASMGVYVKLKLGEKKGAKLYTGFVHISRLSDGKVESISSDSGAYRVGTVHEGRIVGFNALDNLYLLSFEKSVIDQPFLRLEDVTIGANVKGRIERTLIGPNGIDGLIISLAEGITGLVPGMHMSDTKLQHPEKKFCVGGTVNVRILSVDLDKRQLRLTLKKSLVNTDAALWKEYCDVKPGEQSLGTIVNLQQHGAVVQFYGAVRGFLPVSEMSEAYISDPSQHFTVGQVVNVHCLSVDAESNRLVISCKDPATFTAAYKTAFENIKPGDVVSGLVFEKSAEDVLLKLEEGGLVARLAAEHIGDHKPSKVAGALSRVRVGQKLNDLVILDIRRTHRLIRVTGKPSLKEAFGKGELPAKYEDVQIGRKVTGLVRNITPEAVFIGFLGGLTGLLPKRLIKEENAKLPDFGLVKGQTLGTWVSKVEDDNRRFVLSMTPDVAASASASALREKGEKNSAAGVAKSINAVDSTVTSANDIPFGRVTKARVVSVKDTQINVQLADNIQGRIDVSEVFDDWKEIKDRKHPLKGIYQNKQVIDVRVLGIHDARSHRYLPISHRGAKFPVYELCAKKSVLTASEFTPLSLEHVKAGDKYLGFVNNISQDCLWINISPNVRGRLRVTDVSDDLSLVADVQKNFPVGSALRVTVTDVDAERNHLDLTAREGRAQNKLTFADFSKGMILLGRVTKANQHQVLVQLSDTVVGAIGLIDMADDYSQANPGKFNKNDVIRVCIVDIDAANRKINLSVRPSRVLSSNLPVVDREVLSMRDLKQGEIVRGFVRRVADNGVFVTLGHTVTAYIRVSDLSDSYLKEWRDSFQVDQLVRGRLVLVDEENNKIQLSLRESVLNPDYQPPLNIQDLKKGQIVTGKVRKVEDFGAFVVIDGTRNLSGLAHRSEMADNRVDDARKLYEPGDLVKAKILKVDLKKERLSLGLKASYIRDEEDSEPDEDDEETGMDDSEDGGVDLPGLSDSGEDSDGDVLMGDVELGSASDESEAIDKTEGENEDAEMKDAEKSTGLVTGGFNFAGDISEDASDNTDSDSDSDDQASSRKKKKHKKPEIQVDRTGDLDVNGPQTVADYERLLLGEPDSSLLWLKYMAFQLEHGEVDKARQIAERALKTITLGLDAEKLNVWVALLNLENTFGNDETLDEVFKRACQYNDAQEIHERMISIYIQSEKFSKADDLFQTMLKKKFTTKTPELFINYATFLFDKLNEVERGRALLPRAIQSLPKHTHIETTTKFAQLEYRSVNGDAERGRTVFEGLLSSFPKRIDLWNVLIDLEIKVGDVEQIRRLFRRVLNIDNAVGTDGMKSNRKLKEKQAKFFFKKWLEWEEKQDGDDKQKLVDEVKARAAEYVKFLKEAKNAPEEEG
ncbi:rRNA biogenesis protein rrp5 [Ascosphaera aggregata]|nr:rRNA biogenesis protein rrp5 [Ascosphaera aggregata]